MSPRDEVCRGETPLRAPPARGYDAGDPISTAFGGVPMSRMAKLELDGKSYELPIVEGTEKELAIDILSLIHI